MSELASDVAGLKSGLREVKRENARILKMQEQHDQDLYRGDDKMGGVISRVFGTEERLDRIEKSKSERSAREWVVLLAAVSTFITVLVDRIWPHK